MNNNVDISHFYDDFNNDLEKGIIILACLYGVKFTIDFIKFFKKDLIK